MLKINKNIMMGYGVEYTLHPETKSDLIKMVKNEIQENGNKCSLNHINIKRIKDLSYLFTFFETKLFDGDISEWDVSNVEDMSLMFCGSRYTGKNGSINNWDISNVENMSYMFSRSNFNSDISNWSEIFNRNKNTLGMLDGTHIEIKFLPRKI